MHIHYVTSNLRKFQEANHILQDCKEWNLRHTPLSLEEIQGTSREIIYHKAHQALAALQLPLIVEDVAFACPSLGGLPGPYIKSFLQALGPSGVAKLISSSSQSQKHVAEVSCHMVLIGPDLEPIYSVGTVLGEVVDPRFIGENDAMSWNSIFLPEGSKRTFGEMSFEEICAISMRKKALLALHECYHQRKRLKGEEKEAKEA